MTKPLDALDSGLKAFDALMSIINERDAHITKLENVLEVMVAVFRPQQGELCEDIYVATAACDKALTALSPKGEGHEEGDESTFDISETPDPARNEDWIKTAENRASEATLHDELVSDP